MFTDNEYLISDFAKNQYLFNKEVLFYNLILLKQWSRKLEEWWMGPYIMVWKEKIRSYVIDMRREKQKLCQAITLRLIIIGHRLSYNRLHKELGGGTVLVVVLQVRTWWASVVISEFIMYCYIVCIVCIDCIDCFTRIYSFILEPSLIINQMARG